MQDSISKSFHVNEFHRATAKLSEEQLNRLAERLEKMADKDDNAEPDPGIIAQSSD
tara:strand:- start:1932 stop:2099 length:168 start_codon:yes stop_codon:yes gene_type:complete